MYGSLKDIYGVKFAIDVFFFYGDDIIGYFLIKQH